MTDTYKIEYILPGETKVTCGILKNIRIDTTTDHDQTSGHQNVNIISIEKVEA